ncbi:MAG: DNA internalization-related competence protein ComEC/Rec2 [Gemmatimonadota bacterium]|nr:DNA internalization-related competence protein ComEC/Rec2 [Gemmatimonadota bacterium]
MPLIAAACCAYAAGLLLGFGGVLVPALVAAAACVGAGLARRSATIVALSAIAIAGAIVASATRRSDAQCAANALTDSSWQVAVRDSVSPGAFVRGVLRGRCVLPVALGVSAGNAPAGALVLARGRAFIARRGIALRGATVTRVDGRELLPEIRARAGATIDSLFGSDAPLARALLIADESSIDPAVRDRFASAGIVHMLSISGLHVGIIALAVQLFLSALRAPRDAALTCTVLVVLLYVAVIGAPAPALRAAVMLAVVAGCRVAERPASPWAVLALGALTPLENPRTVLDLGWQLSVIGMAGLLASGALARRIIAPRMVGWRARIATAALASSVATVVSAPLVAWSFNRVSLIAPLTNLVAAPVIAIAQPALFLALLCAPLAPVARFLADASHPLLWAFDALASAAAAVPHGSVIVAPALTTALLAGLSAAALVVACVSHFPARPLLVGLGAMTAATWLPLLPDAGRGELELHAIDVGQGDAIALRTPAGRWILVDAGRSWPGGDEGRREVIPYLRRRGGDLALFVLSHPHSDHAGGAATVISALRPREYWDGAYVGGSAPYLESLRAAARAGARWRHVRPGDDITLDGVHLVVLAPDSGWMRTLRDANEGSVALRVEYGLVRFLLVGDAERGEEDWLLRHRPDDLAADVLKVGHHGSSTSSTPAFLATVKPRAAVISVGAGNRYGHPSPAVVGALERASVDVLRTDRVGSVVVATDGRRITIEAGGERWQLRSSPP